MAHVNIDSSASLARFLLENNARIVTNIPFPWSPGHMTHDIDNYLRMRFLGEVDKGTTNFLIFPDAEIPRTMQSVYAHLFTQERRDIFVVNTPVYQLAREVAIMAPELTVDAGLSHAKWALADRTGARMWPFGGGAIYQLPNKRAWALVARWLERRRRSMEFRPFRHAPPPTDALRALIGDGFDRLALIHRRDVTANSAVATEPAQFFPTLEFLRDNGFTIVQVGREPYPDEFARFGVVNYCSSEVASFLHDLILFRHAGIAIISGAGIGSLAQMMDTPLVYTNYWMLLGTFASRCGVWLPAMVRNRRNGRLLKFIEQFQLLWNRPEAWELPPDPYSGSGGGNPQTFTNGMNDFELRPPTADEMLAAAQEVLSLTKEWRPPSDLQKQFNALHPDSALQHQEGRLSQHLAERFAGALEPGF